MGTVFAAPPGVGKSTLIGQIRRTAGDAAHFVEVTEPGGLPNGESTLPLFVYLDAADEWKDQQLADALNQAQRGFVLSRGDVPRRSPTSLPGSYRGGFPEADRC